MDLAGRTGTERGGWGRWRLGDDSFEVLSSLDV